MLYPAALATEATATPAQPTVPALREVAVVIGDNAIRYPQLEGLQNADVQQQINDLIVEKANITQHMVTLTTLKAGSTGLQVNYSAYLKDDMLSLVVNANGVLENGRVGQEYTALGFHLTDGKPLTLDDLFTDVQAAATMMEETLEATYLDELGSYVENSSLSPLPMDNFYIDADGITFYYPTSQFSLVTGSAGAAQFFYDELDQYLRPEAEALPARLGLLPEALSDAQIKAAVSYAVSQGALPHIPVKLGEEMTAVIARYQLLREPDQYAGGRLCQLQAPVFRQVQVITDALTSTFGNSRVNGLLCYRGSLFGLRVGATTQARWRDVLGESDSTVDFDENIAYNYGFPVGTADYYTYGNVQLLLYADETDVLYAIRITQN